MGECVQIHPLEPRIHNRFRNLTFLGPDALDDRLEANAMLVEAPDLYLGLGADSGNVLKGLRQLFFLKSSAFAGSPFL